MNTVTASRRFIILSVLALLGACNATPGQPSAPLAASSCTLDSASGMTRCYFPTEGSHLAVQLHLTRPQPVQVYAESRRLVFDSQLLSAVNDPVSFDVNIRTPEGQPIQEGTDPGTPGLTLYLSVPPQQVASIRVAPVTPEKRLFIIGDSTVADQDPQWNKAPYNRYTGWGQVLPAYFDDTISVVNYADSGEGSYAYTPLEQVLWPVIAPQMKANDVVLIQLGHNDKTTPEALYTARMQALIEAIKAKGAKPVLVTPMIRNLNKPLAQQHIWPQLNVRQALLALADKEQIPLIDLMAVSQAWVDNLGQEAAQRYFVTGDRTHSNPWGARVFASMVMQALPDKAPSLLPNIRLLNTALSEKPPQG